MKTNRHGGAIAVATAFIAMSELQLPIRGYDVYVHSNHPDQVDQDVTATSGTHSKTWHTDSSATPTYTSAGRPSGNPIMVQVGSATCTTTTKRCLSAKAVMNHPLRPVMNSGAAVRRPPRRMSVFEGSLVNPRRPSRVPSQTDVNCSV